MEPRTLLCEIRCKLGGA